MLTLENVISLLRQRIGLEVDSIGQSAIEWAVRDRMAERKISELSEYTVDLLKDATEQKALIERVVISETWFFREAAAFQALEKLARTKWLDRAPLSKVRLLSLPCATGEEPYSMIMALLQAGLDPASIQVDALDVSLRVLQLARAGVYRQHSFRGAALGYRDLFFTREGDGRYVIDEKIRSHVRFEQGNILDPPAWLTGRHYDIIFCRNLLIYLDAANRRKALAVLRRLLKPSGLIFVGHAEIQEMINGGFDRYGDTKAFAFCLPGRAVSKPSKPRVSQLASPAKPRAIRADVIGRPCVTTESEPAFDPSDFAEISRLANRGDYAQATVLCERVLRAAPAAAEGHFWLGVIRQAQAQMQKAEESFRKALYLDPAHYQTLVHLALLLESRGEVQNASLLRRRAERLDPVSS